MAEQRIAADGKHVEDHLGEAGVPEQREDP